MTYDQYQDLAVGDILTNPQIPWTFWVIYNVVSNENGPNTYCAVRPVSQSEGSRDTIRIYGPGDWEIYSKVIGRITFEEFDYV